MSSSSSANTSSARPGPQPQAAAMRAGTGRTMVSPLRHPGLGSSSTSTRRPERARGGHGLEPLSAEKKIA
jgi:hypothetical protein